VGLFASTLPILPAFNVHIDWIRDVFTVSLAGIVHKTSEKFEKTEPESPIRFLLQWLQAISAAIGRRLYLRPQRILPHSAHRSVLTICSTFLQTSS